MSDQKELEVTFARADELQITTESSIWRIRPDLTYQRAPRTGARTHKTFSIDGALDDLEWHSYEQAWWLGDSEGPMRLRILPVGRHPGAYGIVSGLIETIDRVSL